MKKAVLFDEFARCCSYFNPEKANGYGCDHPNQRDTDIYDGKRVGRCFCHTCPLGVEAEQQDLTEPDHPDAIPDIDWDGLCSDGEVYESEYLLIEIGDNATEEEKRELYLYERHMHRYDKKWLDEHGIPNSLVG